MAFKHCLVFLAFCLPFSGAKVSDLELDDYDYDEVFKQLKTTERPAVTLTLMKPPVEYVPTTPMPDIVDYTDYSNQYVEKTNFEGKTFNIFFSGKIIFIFS